MRRHLAMIVLPGTLAAGLGYTYVVQDRPPGFITETVQRGTISRTIRASGDVEAIASVDVSSQLSGRIADVFVDFNDVVKAGQPLARLDQEIFTARVNEARAALMVAQASIILEQSAAQRAKGAIDSARTAHNIAQSQLVASDARQGEAERDLQRQTVLVRTGAVSDRDFGRARASRDAGAAEMRAAAQQVELKSQAIAMAEAELRMAEARVLNAEAIRDQQQATLSQAELDLARTVLRAPIDGVIIKRDINPGQTVAVSLDAKTLFTIANDLRGMVVHGKIDEADVGQIKVGQDARFTVDAYPDRTFSGRVLQVRKSPEIVQNVVTYTAIISAANPELLLYPGMTALLRIVVADSVASLTIPNEALRFHPPNTMPGASATVWVVDTSGRPSPVTVDVGAGDDRRTAVRDGKLTEGQALIVGMTDPHSKSGSWGIRLGF